MKMQLRCLRGRCRFPTINNGQLLAAINSIGIDRTITHRPIEHLDQNYYLQLVVASWYW